LRELHWNFTFGGKLAEIVGGSEIPGVWVLGATIEIETQVLVPFTWWRKVNCCREFHYNLGTVPDN